MWTGRKISRWLACTEVHRVWNIWLVQNTEKLLYYGQVCRIIRRLTVIIINDTIKSELVTFSFSAVTLNSLNSSKRCHSDQRSKDSWNLWYDIIKQTKLRNDLQALLCSSLRSNVASIITGHEDVTFVGDA